MASLGDTSGQGDGKYQYKDAPYESLAGMQDSRDAADDKVHDEGVSLLYLASAFSRQARVIDSSCGRFD